MKLTSQEIAEAVGAINQTTFPQDSMVTSVEFDTRNVGPGSLFVPLKGARDGHDFINNAFEAGAVLTLSEKPLSDGTPFILVEDTLLALQQLAHWYLNRVNPKVVGITGSNGKTTTKDMTAAVLATTYKTYKTQGNFNNQIGMPVTILHMPMDTEMLVLEMGMDRPGEIAALTEIATPDTAAITMIGESHIEFFGTRAKIAQAKMEIASGLASDGTLIVPSDEPLLRPLLDSVTQDIQMFGSTGNEAITATITRTTQAMTAFTTSKSETIEFEIPVLGTYNVSNALIAILIGSKYSVPVAEMKAALADFSLTKNRTEWFKTENDVAILSDVYNANPTAMRLVVDSFSEIPVSGDRVVVLGDMLELGDLSKELHESIAPHLLPEKIQTVCLYGEEMKALYEKIAPIYQEKIVYFNKSEREMLKKWLEKTLKSGDAILFKGSNGMKLNEFVENLLSL
ncbi:UDP-N-acetylmuramoyl-tripeptide--D-alanyl-D-alanine ligase [Vagococcus silagei]|uniref:UDP-N-acetylmuramoyl-tripeptide--D-alanyl-D-alanine ligase n=1 Tax=Vagococcus silagei TaxID=2508885 RepID=A0A4V3TV04_9ENTE|nr:UDP-N-acetylmuramoyl-tripeptide--D-alanyl-D-alanine ligase [Vagococcus silagei]THB61049.1 UDP-N-acetylmuramoyl-tripeptide--D-alanyl-D-alanine ligase [Vagococcus silagei]